MIETKKTSAQTQSGEWRNFRKVTEDFECSNCDKQVKGNGHTNHCPCCLTSKHVDTNIGDRSSECGGLMKAVGVTIKAGDFDKIIFCCESCGLERPNKVQPEDNRDLLIALLLEQNG